ncbi:hypothetical protein LOCC1_G005843 [Lachnellula occidentalis]|uniref:Uncharacterized protein n=1 Tax=Lachnellula occidentalis TaxID=215460 RepID=A0A8H8UEF7_9HELO|nr:hypothetical protein LOCC1_G005843 [Lachnellula occidentalis]
MDMDMHSVKLDLHGLPLETLQQIAGHVNRSHRPSLYAFGLASRTCRGATLPLIFDHLHLNINSREALQRNVDALVPILSQTESAGHVRCLSIKGSFRLSDAPRSEGYRYGSEIRHSWFAATGVDEILGGEEPYQLSPHVVYDEPVIARSSEEDLAWAPVVSLIHTLPHLTKLIYDCRNQFPPSLLDALHDHHPQCKLYHLTFRFRTLLWGTPYPYEMALATSPYLYSVKVECCQRDSDGDDDFNQEAIMELVAGLAPNLKEVVVVNLTPDYSRRYYRRPREPWRGLPGFVSGQSIGSLTSLSLLGAVDLGSLGLLQAWARHTDFSRLRHLALGGGYGCENIGVNGEEMEWIAQNCSFRQLKTLGVRMDRDDFHVERPNYVNNAVTFLRAFEPLDQLSVSGALEPKILDAILDHHGPTLKKLTLRPSEEEFSVSNLRVRRDIPMTFTKEHILQIHSQCPALQELAISVKRTKSDRLEAEMYKSFGQMAQLKSLFLTLDCSDWRVMRDADSPADASFDAFDRENCKWFGSEFLKNGHLRETLMNCAVDETLVRSIWETICRNKVGQELESLKVWTTGGGHWGTTRTNCAIAPVVNHLSRSWLVERVCRDGGDDIINVRELGRRVREARDQKQTDEYRRRAEALGEQEHLTISPRDVAEDSPVVQAFRRVWPPKEGSRDWRDDWSSLPLQV